MSITVTVGDIAKTEEVKARIATVMRQAHRLRADQNDDFEIESSDQFLKSFETVTTTVTLVMGGVVGIALIVGGIGIMNIMLVSVTERTREIGLRMAVGARTRDILGQFLVEAVTLSLIGGLAGVALGIGGSLLIAELAGWRSVITPQAVGLAGAFAGGIGVFFGFYPARKAARRHPGEALRVE
jgi:putative ABC transport system permease protein